ncbi:hypothetical protein [Acinetobacter sp. YH12063]|uniref:hypothetical protein n=1 Tax=Acinetobacter sp. YH12063 TaxID=2601061 RepID=UPI0015D32E8A|nr:hypothetical protein [Acinetobacter sp. YH12063]
MPNIHQITRQRIQSPDFAYKKGLVKRISSILKQVWECNQITSKNPSGEQIQAWISGLANNTSYCSYIAIGVANSDVTYPLGNWNIPFYSFEEASQFKKEAELKYPNLSFNFILGTLLIDKAMEHVSCVFWKKWQQKHNERLEGLKTNKKVVIL